MKRDRITKKIPRPALAVAGRPRVWLAGLLVLAVVAVAGYAAVRGGRAAGVVGDINGDGVVNVLDLSILLTDWGTNNASADLNGDGTVNILDLSALLSHWGQTGPTPTPTPTPSPLAGCTSAGVVAPCIGGPTTGASGWGTPVFDDEFNGTALDTSKYWHDTWFSGNKMNNVNTSAANVAVSGGNLVLTLSSSTLGALVDTDPSQAPTGFQFSTGYYVEGRIYFPGPNGTTNYNWPAFWTDGQNWPQNGETDIAEGLGTMTSNYWSGTGSGTPNNSGTIPGNWINSWHTYAFDREAGTNYVYWDGKLIRSYTTHDSGSPHYLIVNVGDGQGPTQTGAAGQVKVDYVRVWKKQ